jgi:hypothetical protein
MGADWAAISLPGAPDRKGGLLLPSRVFWAIRSGV